MIPSRIGSVGRLANQLRILELLNPDEGQRIYAHQREGPSSPGTKRSTTISLSIFYAGDQTLSEPECDEVLVHSRDALRF